MIQLDQTFAALADPTRRAILARLAEGEATVGELSRPFDISAPAISRHLRVLEKASLIESERDGKHRRCRLHPLALKTATEWLDFYRRCWSGTLEKLDAHLQGTKGNPDDPH